jgi:hypothetical protein
MPLFLPDELIAVFTVFVLPFIFPPRSRRELREHTFSLEKLLLSSLSGGPNLRLFSKS